MQERSRRYLGLPCVWLCVAVLGVGALSGLVGVLELLGRAATQQPPL